MYIYIPVHMQIFICVDIRGEELHAKPMHTVRTQLARYIVRTLETMGRSKKSRPRRARDESSNKLCPRVDSGLGLARVTW